MLLSKTPLGKKMGVTYSKHKAIQFQVPNFQAAPAEI